MHFFISFHVYNNIRWKNLIIGQYVCQFGIYVMTNEYVCLYYILCFKGKGKKYSSLQTASPLRELSVTCHLAEVTFPPLPQPIKAGTRFSDPGGMQGWVDLVGLVTYRGGTSIRRQSPIPVLTGLNVEQLCWCDERRYRYAKPTNSYVIGHSLIFIHLFVMSAKWTQWNWWTYCLHLCLCVCPSVSTHI